VLLVMGGSLGAQKLNELVRAALPILNRTFDVIHLCGRGKNDCGCVACGYHQYEYIDKELPDLFALSDVVLSRAGANSVFELLALNKPSVLVPLTSASTRGDQMLNANYFKKKGYAEVLDQNTATPESLVSAILAVYDNRERYAAAMREDTRSDGTQAILRIIRETAGHA
jgi:UDP-N-acetylglucosamine--N-acetylmuramyl-(pentapeptide) pyrophosphoryl-undecaprenol N-acetylglucosamine transferase